MARPSGAADFALTRVIGPKSAPGPELFALVSTSGPPLSPADLEDKNNWRLAALISGNQRNVPIRRATWQPVTKQVSLFFSRNDLENVNLPAVGWQALFIGDNRQLTASSGAALGGGKFKAAKGKDDASLYLFGSLLAGPATKPLYVIDTKFDYKQEIRTTGTFWHAAAAASTNTNAQPPVNKVRIDPDSITTSLLFSKTVNVNRYSVYGLDFTLSPLTGEFTRKSGVADAVASARATVTFSPIRQMMAFYPTVGFDAGHAIKRPTKIGGQAVDLSEWGGIGRAVAGGVAELYFFKPDPKADDWYYVTFDASYTLRKPLAAEPIEQQKTVNGQATAVTSVNKDARHQVEASVHWNLNAYAGIQLQYKYGAQPPLFPVVDHQVTIGVTLKAAQK